MPLCDICTDFELLSSILTKCLPDFDLFSSANQSFCNMFWGLMFKLVILQLLRSPLIEIKKKTPRVPKVHILEKVDILENIAVLATQNFISGVSSEF